MGKRLPEAEDYLLRVGGWQVRNAGTIGGNIANGSPIGETPPLLIALGARIVLRRRSERREIALEDFFIAYGKQDRRPANSSRPLFKGMIPNPDRDPLGGFGLSLLVLLVILAVSEFGKGFVVNISVLIGIVVGAIVAAVLGRSISTRSGQPRPLD